MQSVKSTVAFPQEAQDCFPDSNQVPKPEYMLFLLITFPLVITLFTLFINFFLLHIYYYIAYHLLQLLTFDFFIFIYESACK